MTMTKNNAKTELETLCRRAPFDRLTPDQQLWLGEHLLPRDYQRGDALLLPGAQAQTLFFILRGTVQLEAMGKVSEENRVLAELVEGESFPLEALQDERPVFSTFRARTEVHCLELPIDDFRELCRMSPSFDEFCRQRATAFLEQARRIYHAHFSADATSTHLASPLRGLIRGAPASCIPTEPLSAVLQRMERDGLKLLAVVNDAGKPLGTFSLAELLKAYNSEYADPITPVGELMSTDLICLPAEALCFEAALLMAERGLSHVLVMDAGRLAAVVAERALFALQSVGISQSAFEIRNTKRKADLVSCTADIHQLAHNMLGQGSRPIN
jgi:CBS domain-containing protein